MAASGYQVIASGTLAGQFVQNVFHFKGEEVSATEPYNNARAILEELNTPDMWVAKWVGCLPEDYKMSSLKCRRSFPTGGPTAILLAGALFATTGARTGQIQAAQVNPLVIWIPETSPAKTGRTFLPGISEDDLDAMVYDVGLITAVDDFIGQHLAPLTVSSFTGSVYAALQRRSPTASVDRVENGRLSPLIGTQRRRLRPT